MIDLHDEEERQYWERMTNKELVDHVIALDAMLRQLTIRVDQLTEASILALSLIRKKSETIN